MDWTKVLMQTRSRLILPGGVTVEPEGGEEWSEPFSLEASDLEAGVRPELWVRTGVCRIVTKAPKAAPTKGDGAGAGDSEPKPDAKATTPPTGGKAVT